MEVKRAGEEKGEAKEGERRYSERLEKEGCGIREREEGKKEKNGGRGRVREEAKRKGREEGKVQEEGGEEREQGEETRV